MPEKDNWKGEFRGYFDKTLKPKKETIKNLDREIVVDFISKLLSSQAHALKEQMKACVPEKQSVVFDGSSSAKFGKGWESQGFNQCREQTLSAIESIEI